jgi:hypothetical protein
LTRVPAEPGSNGYKVFVVLLIFIAAPASLRGAKRRGNPEPSLALDCFASLAMTKWWQVMTER